MVTLRVFLQSDDEEDEDDEEDDIRFEALVPPLAEPQDLFPHISMPIISQDPTDIADKERQDAYLAFMDAAFRVAQHDKQQAVRQHDQQQSVVADGQEVDEKLPEIRVKIESRQKAVEMFQPVTTKIVLRKKAVSNSERFGNTHTVEYREDDFKARQTLSLFFLRLCFVATFVVSVSNAVSLVTGKIDHRLLVSTLKTFGAEMRMEHTLVDSRLDSKTAAQQVFRDGSKWIVEYFDECIRSQERSCYDSLKPVAFGSFTKHPNHPGVDLLVSANGLTAGRGRISACGQQKLFPVPPRQEDGKPAKFMIEPVISLNQFHHDTVLRKLGHDMITCLGSFNTGNLMLQLGLFTVNGYMHDDLHDFLGGTMSVKEIGPPGSGKTQSAKLGSVACGISEGDIIFGKATEAAQFLLQRLVRFFSFSPLIFFSRA